MLCRMKTTFKVKEKEYLVWFLLQITETEGEFVKIRKKALERLTTEVMQLHDILPRVLTSDILENFQKLDVVEACEFH